MTSRLRAGPRFHPDLRVLSHILPRQMVRPSTLRVARFLAGTPGRPSRNVEIHPLPGGANVRVFRPPRATATAGGLVWMHGGGYVLGCAAQDDALCRRFAKRLGITVVSVDYRLAPEHPFPTPVDDCIEAVRWIAAADGVDSRLVAVGGASAGGGLAASVALRARDAGDLTLCFQLLVYPMLDDRTLVDPPGRASQLRLWNAAANRFGWEAYLGRADRESAVPARRVDLSGLPPTWIGVGDLDLFHDEDLLYASRLRACGVACTVDTVEGAFHGFDLVLPRADVSRHFFSRQVAALRETLA